MRPRRSDEDRRQYALAILANTRANRGAELAKLILPDYFAFRGIKAVPATALCGFPYLTIGTDEKLLLPDSTAMIFEVTDGDRVVGAHVTWIDAFAGFSVRPPHPMHEILPEHFPLDPRPVLIDRPKRQCYGPISGGYIRLYDGETPSTLVIGEGVETSMAFSQLGDFSPGIAALSAGNLEKIIPPLAGKYIVAGDSDVKGTGQRAAWALAARLQRRGHQVSVAIPEQADHASKTDWNDVLLEE